MSGAQVLGLALLIFAAVMVLDRSRGRLAQWLYTPTLKIRIPARPWWSDDEPRPDLSALFGPPERHLSSVKPLDRANLRASHTAEVVDLASRKRVS